MSIEGTETQPESLFDCIEINEIVEFDGGLIPEEITSKLEEHLREESVDGDTMDGVFDAIKALSSDVREEFEDLLEGDNDKKCFLKSLSKIFTLLLNTKVSTTNEIKQKLDLQQKQPSKYGQDKTNLRKLMENQRRLMDIYDRVNKKPQNTAI